MGDSSHSHSHAHQEEQCCNDHAPQPRESIFRLEAMDSVFDKACAAAGAGDLNQLKQYLLSNAISIDEVDGNGNTLLHFAATLNRTEVCDFLLQLCAFTLLFEAHITPQLIDLEFILIPPKKSEKYAGPSLLSVRNRENGHTPVHWAASSGAIGSLHLFSKYNNTCLFELDNSGSSTKSNLSEISPPHSCRGRRCYIFSSLYIRHFSYIFFNVSFSFRSQFVRYTEIP